MTRSNSCGDLTRRRARARAKRGSFILRWIGFLIIRCQSAPFERHAETVAQVQCEPRMRFDPVSERHIRASNADDGPGRWLRARGTLPSWQSFYQLGFPLVCLRASDCSNGNFAYRHRAKEFDFLALRHFDGIQLGLTATPWTAEADLLPDPEDGHFVRGPTEPSGQEIGRRHADRQRPMNAHSTADSRLVAALAHRLSHIPTRNCYLPVNRRLRRRNRRDSRAHDVRPTPLQFDREDGVPGARHSRGDGSLFRVLHARDRHTVRS